ncbi:MAG: hypothetical protein M5U34_12505 [Chloroflexi bacterium]|nr:hypothetical protein [Chloroflexota bacterium]
MRCEASLKREIEKFVQVFPQVRVLVTSRPYAYGSSWQLPDFQVTRLLPFDDEQIETFINQWYTAKGSTLGPEQADQYAKSLIREVKDKRKNHLRDLAERPLLLTMMVSIHRGQHGEELPQNAPNFMPKA